MKMSASVSKKKKGGGRGVLSVRSLQQTCRAPVLWFTGNRRRLLASMASVRAFLFCCVGAAWGGTDGKVFFLASAFFCTTLR